MPGLWNFYFRQQLNQGMSSKAISRGGRSERAQQIEQDATADAIDLYEKPQKGIYFTESQQRLPIDGQMDKLIFA